MLSHSATGKQYPYLFWEADVVGKALFQMDVDAAACGPAVGGRITGVRCAACTHFTVPTSGFGLDVRELDLVMTASVTWLTKRWRRVREGQ